MNRIEDINKLSFDSEQDKLKKQQEIYQQNPDSYNGAIRKNYSWTQNSNDIDINIKVNFQRNIPKNF